MRNSRPCSFTVQNFTPILTRTEESRRFYFPNILFSHLSDRPNRLFRTPFSFATSNFGPLWKAERTFHHSFKLTSSYFCGLCSPAQTFCLLYNKRGQPSTSLQEPHRPSETSLWSKVKLVNDVTLLPSLYKLFYIEKSALCKKVVVFLHCWEA